MEAALRRTREKVLDLSSQLAAQAVASFAYGTVVAIVEKLQPKKAVSSPLAKIEERPAPKRSGFGNTFINAASQPVLVDAEVQALDEFLIGDHFVVKAGVEVSPAISSAKTRVIVGFTSKNEIISQLDQKFVVVHTPSEHRQLFDLMGDVLETSPEGEMETVPYAVVMFEGRVLEVALPQGIEVGPGDTVALNQKNFAIMSKGLLQISGEIAVVSRVVDEVSSEIEHRNSTKVVFNGRFGKELEKGDRVVLDSSGIVIVKNLGKDEERFVVISVPKTTWDDIGGLEQAKEDMIEAVELPHRFRRLFGFYSRKTVKGILLYGPPGCGKTLLGEAVAHAMAEIYGNGETAEGFIYVKGPEILEKYVGMAEANIRQLFDRARRHKAKYGYPAIIFIDEAEAILSTRGSGVSSDVDKTIVPAFLNEMNGLGDSGAIVILATNRPDMLDPAVVRDGRVDLKIMVTRPTPKSTKDILLRNLRGKPLANGLTMEELAAYGSEEFFSASRKLYEVRKRDGSVVFFTLKEILNGAMIANAVNMATSFALRRDLAKMRAAGAGDDEVEKFASGITKEDLFAAINRAQQQTSDLNFMDDLEQFVHDFKDDLVGVEKLRQGSG